MKLDFSIRERLAIGFGLILTLLLVLLGITLHKFHQLDLYQAQMAVIAERADEAVAIQTSWMNESIAIHSFIATHNPAYLVTYRMERRIRESAIERLQQLPKTPDGLDLFNRIIQVAHEFEHYVNEIIPQIESGGNLRDMPARENHLRELRARLLDATRLFTRLQTEKRNKTIRDLEVTQAAMIDMFLLFVAGIIVISFVTALLTTHAIRQPVRLLVESIDAVAEGRYEPALELAARYPQPPDTIRDELHRVAARFSRMAGARRRHEVRLAADNRLSAALASTLDPRRLTAEALREVLEFTRAAAGAVYVLDPEKNMLYPAASSAMPALPEWLALPADEGAPEVGQGHCLPLRQLPETSPWRALAAGNGAAEDSLWLLPLLFQHRAIGLMLLRGGAGWCGNDDSMDFLEHAARHLSISLQNVLTHDGATRLAGELSLKNCQLELQNDMLHAQGGQLQAQSAQLHAQNEELRRQADELSTANGRLADNDRRKDEFLAMLAHELRNPLAAISSANFVLELGRSNPGQAAKMRSVVTRQVKHLSRMVDDLLDVSRITQGKVGLRREIVDLAESVNHAVEACQSAIEKSRQHLEVTLPPEPLLVDADPTRLEQMICNLLQNATKYTEPEGWIWLSVETEEGWALVRIRDSGIGISPEVLPHVFELFAQADRGPDRTQGGLGIGLTMVRALAGMHGGTIEAASAGIGQGSEFLLRLPRPNPALKPASVYTPPAAEAI